MKSRKKIIRGDCMYISFSKKYSLCQFILIVLLLFVIAEVKGQGPEKIQFHHITPEDGLSQSTVHAILQDSKGYMWFATQDGLNKYNGYEISTYRNDPDDPHSISLSDIRSLYEDKKGNLWIGTLGGGLNLYDRDMDHFVRFKGDIEKPQQSLSDNSVWDIYEDSRGNFWVGTSWGLNLMKREGEKNSEYLKKVTHFVKEKDNPNSISSNNISDIYEDSRDNLWIGTEKGLNILNRETGEFKRFLHNSEDPNSIGSNHITTIYEDQEGTLWVGTLGGGLNYYDYENQHFHNYLHSENDSGSIAENSVYAIWEDSDGSLWVGTSNKGLNLFDRSEDQFYRYQYDKSDPNSINNDAINSIYESSDNILWIGTFTGGVNFADRKSKMFEHYKSNPMADYSLSHNVVRSFLETSSGKFLIGTDGGGLNIFNRETSRFDVLQHDPNNQNSIPSDVILNMDEDQEGHIWVGTYGGGLSLFDIDNQTFKNYKYNPDDPESLSSNDVFQLTSDQQNRLWIGTNRGGINLLKPGSQGFIQYMEDSEQNHSIENNDIRSVYEDSKGNIWIGSYGGRLAEFKSEKNGFAHYDINSGNLYSSVIQSMYEDQNQRFWLGTRGGGLKLFDRATHEITTYSTKDGLPSNIINGILGDDSGNLWISSNEGISKFDPETQNITNYNLDKGLQSREFSPGAAYKDQQGYMYFGGVNGFNRFHPDSINKNQEVPPVVFTDFQLFNKSVSIGGDSPLEKHISQTDRLVLPYSAAVLTFEYTALNFSPRKSTQFAYKLEGFDQEWNYVDKKKSATYTNLDPGDYVLRIKASSGDDVWNEGTEIAIVIPPPFWQTTWFYLLVIFLIVATIYFAYRWRMYAIQEQNRQLEQEVTERTAELDKRNKELETMLRELEETRGKLVEKAHKAGMADLATGVLHNIGNVLNSVNISTTVLVETLEKSKIPKFKQANELLHAHRDNLEEFLLEDHRGMKLLDYYLKLEEPMEEEYEKLKTHCNRLTEKVQLIMEVIDAQQDFAKVGRIKERIQLEQLVEDTLKLQAGSITRHGLTIKKEFEDTDSVIIQKSKLIHILVNLFKNAKEAMKDLEPEDKTVTIRTYQNENYVKLSVADKGTGIKEEDLNKVFNHGFTTKTSGHGFGLHSCANYMTEMGGKIRVKSKGEGKGAEFILVFPKVKVNEQINA